ncbi:rdx family domain-containing protein [Ditylenchus destructor]|nr:rdx family domain-containing protein [Ditylenchus destructor]
MADKVFVLIFSMLFAYSIFEGIVMTDHNSNSEEEQFHEFDEDPDYKYSEKANLKDTSVDETGDIEIRPPVGSEASKAFQTPTDMPTLKFLYCVSCGYKQAFDQFSQVIQDKYPGVVIEGGNFPPSTPKALFSQFIGVAKIALIVMVIMGRDPFQSMGMTTPTVFTWMLNNKLSSCLMMFMLSNSIEGMLMSTGAFEIYFGEEQIWSKLESGRVPSPVELLQAIDSHLAIRGSKVPSSFGFDNN